MELVEREETGYRVMTAGDVLSFIDDLRLYLRVSNYDDIPDIFLKLRLEARERIARSSDLDFVTKHVLDSIEHARAEEERKRQ